MVWISVDNPDLQRFLYKEYGMESPATVTDNRKAQVTQEVANELFDNHPDGFSQAEEAETYDAEAQDENTDQADEASSEESDEESDEDAEE